MEEGIEGRSSHINPTGSRKPANAGDCATRRISRTLRAKFSKGKFRAVGEKLKTKNAKQSIYSLSH